MRTFDSIVRRMLLRRRDCNAGEDCAARCRHSVCGGGTTLIDLMKLEVETPERLLDINRLPFDKDRRSAEWRVKIAPRFEIQISRTT